MKVEMYETHGGKNLILDYINDLSSAEKAEAFVIIRKLRKRGKDVLDELDTRQVDGKLWEIKFYRHNRIFYCMVEEEKIFLLHACQKQKAKAEKFNLDTAKRRMKEVF